MIDVYTANTPNGIKIPIALEELGVAYKVIRLNLGDGEQKRPEFLAINPNGRIPAIVDHDGPNHSSLSVFESGAILVYLAEKYGALMPKDLQGRVAALEWLFFQIGGVGPIFGQYGWFNNSAPEKMPLALQRYQQESMRLSAVLESRLSKNAWLAGNEYSIADIANFCWLRNARYGGVDIELFPAVKAWAHKISQRPAVQRGLAAINAT